MSIPSHILEQLNSQADLVGMISKHTTLKRSGGTFRGKCPFHKGNSQSFSVHPQKNLYHCFKCDASGNTFTFLKEYENLTFMEAVDELARQTGIEVPKEDRRELKYKRHPQPAISNGPKPPVNNGPKPPVNHTTANNQAKNKQSKNRQPDARLQPSHLAQNSTVQTATSPSSLEYDDYFMGNTSLADGPPPGWHEGYDNSMPSQPSGSPYSESPYQEPSFNDNIPFIDQDSGPVTSPAHLPSNFATPDSNEGNLYDLLVNVGKFYQANLQANSAAMQYFKSRGLTDATITEFGLGYAPAGWQHLETNFPQDIEGLKALGLVRKSEKGREYDLLRDRVIFPIRDNQGRVIGFAGRALDNEAKPKYINSSDSPVFHKQHVLYGYYESRQHRPKKWVVVEGYMDVIALYQAGIYGAVASMGTSINDSQIARLWQMNPVLTLCFDGDSAGQKAAWRTLEVALPILDDNKELRFLTLPGDHDPDTFIAANGVQAMREQITHAVPLSQYVYAYLSERHDLSKPEGKAKLMAQVRELTSKLPKGSSFKHLLNSDIYQKISGRKAFKKTTAHDALLDFDSGMTSIDQLELCLLFNPQILADDPIAKLWQDSGVSQLVAPKLKADVSLPPLPSWEDFNDANLSQLIAVITSLLAYLPANPNEANNADSDTDSSDATLNPVNNDSTNATAHFILANLPKQTQQSLSQRWHAFWSNLNEREVIEIKELTDELLIHLMLAALKSQMQAAKNIVVINHINKQRQTLANWHKRQQAEQATKIG